MLQGASNLGMVKRIGRPPVKKTDLRRKTISLRLKANEVNELRKVANLHGETLSNWVRKKVLEGQ